MDKVILVSALMFLIASISSKIARRLGIPALLIFLFIGILFGSDGLGFMYFDNNYAAQFIGVIALCYILFMGGLSIDFKEMRPVIWDGISLASTGVFVTAIITGFLGYYFLNFDLYICILIGAIVSSTDAAAVFGILRSKDINLAKNLKPLLEFESGSNDPMAVFLTISAISLVSGEAGSIGNFVFMFFKQMILGIIIGYIAAKLAVKLINKIHLEYNGLYVVLTIAIVIFTYSFSQITGGNGFMSVYICALTMSVSKFVHKKMLIKFHDGIAWLMQIIMFLILGLSVSVKELYIEAKPSLILTFILVFISRPLAVFLSLAFSKYSFREKMFISWVGLKGAAPIILATFPLLANISGAREIFNIIFFVVIISVIIQGTTIPLFVKLLKVDTPYRPELSSPFEFEEGESSKHLFKFQISENSPVINKTTKDLKLPPNTLITMISREGDYLIPNGNTKYEECDIVFILSDFENESNLKDIFDRC